MFIFVIIGLAYLPLQIAAWKKWTGPWFYWSFAPAVIPISGCAFGLVKNSNLWPFWGGVSFSLQLINARSSLVLSFLYGAKKKPD